MNAPKWFSKLGIQEHCVERKSSCSEKSRSFSISPAAGDEIWRVRVDDCWIGGERKKVDYLFWVRSKADRKGFVLVELKGSNYGKALDQIADTLKFLCKHSPGNVIHRGPHNESPGHDMVSQKGVQAFVVLSQGRSASKRTSRRGRKLPQRLARLERIRQRYNIRVNSTTNRCEIKGVDKLFI